MKYISLVLSLLFIVGCTHVPDTSSTSLPLNVDGTWKGIWKDNKKKDGKTTRQLIILKLKSHGDTLTGSACNAATYPRQWVKLQKVKLKGNVLSLEAKFLPGLKAGARGSIEGDKMDLTFKGTLLFIFNLFKGSVTLEREQSYDSARELKVAGVSTNVMTFGLEKRDPKEPVIILQSGANVPMEYWGSLIPLITECGPVIAYDRPGTGGSSFNGIDPEPEYVAGHLHELLKTLKVPPPYILVGHSWGGPLILYYAGQYPAEVAAMVYIDPTDPMLTSETMYMTSDKDKIAEMKAEREVLVKRLLSSNPGAEAENRVLENFMDMPLEKRNLPDNPVVPTEVILATRFDNQEDNSPMNEERFNKFIDLRIKRFREITSSLPQGTLTLAADAGHNIPMEAPDLIADAIRRVKAQFQTGSSR